jgi:hypothetical protein
VILRMPLGTTLKNRRQFSHVDKWRHI